MVATYKLFILGLLVTTAVVLSTTVMTLSLFAERKRREVRNRKQRASSSSGGSSPNVLNEDDASSSSFSRRFKTVRPAVLPDGSDLNLRRSGPAPDSSSFSAADAHFAKAVRLIPFENTGGEAGNAVPSHLLHSAEGREDRRGADFVKWARREYWGLRSMVYGRRRGGSMG
eukprot:CAMPEP_0113566172 /NCGR_PEP_ID=MMETSP0015_2-20120614/22579_1 /TAXON_ID=2838 /ORGANISM="Odontella" /LENGTH=170 /DNA_ID=CAMNT_0000468439 /DNA_START=71 /DNA_END=580 /DNA_ORIENTATION=+ /assembly_acc=CAM_ASM_000160